MRPRSIYERICRVAIKEWNDNKCRRCLGRGYTTAVGALKSVCPWCGGTQLGLHSDSERMRDTGIDPRAYQKWAPVFAKALREISDACDRVERKLPRHLGRHMS